MDAPPVLTPERIDAMLSIMAEVCLEGVMEGGRRQKAAEDDEAFERCGRTLQVACRNLRQTIAMKQRHDREQTRAAEDARRLAETLRQDTERARDKAITIRRAQVRRHFDRVLWNEYEPDEADDLLDHLNDRLRDLSLEDDFLDVPTEVLIQRLADDIGLDDEDARQDAPEAAAPALLPHRGRGTLRSRVEGEPGGRDGGGEPPPPPAAVPFALRGRSAEIPPPDPDLAPAAEATPPPDPPPEASPEPPPEPPPEPYIPPWEKLRPGQVIPGGSGW